MLTAIRDLINIASGIKLQNKDHLACLINIINKPVFAKSHPESGLMDFALFNIKIGDEISTNLNLEGYGFSLRRSISFPTFS